MIALLLGEIDLPRDLHLTKERLMKKHAAALLILMLAGLAGLVNAQSRPLVAAEVPFNYIANGRTMPAGECTVRVDNDGASILWIASEDRQILAMAAANDSTKAAEETTLVFHKYGTQYFLAGVTRQGQYRSYTLPAGRLEKELRASNVEEKDVMLVASLTMF